MFAPTDAPTELVELAETEPVGVFDHHDRGVGHIDPDLDDRGGDQDVELAAAEPVHHPVLLVGPQLAVE